MRRERMSRPSSSVPHQWVDDGPARRAGRSMWAGSWGAIQGANKAQMTKIATNTAPVDASTLWRAARWNEMAVVDIGRSLMCPFLWHFGFPLPHDLLKRQTNRLGS